MKWSRVLIQAAKACSCALRDKELDELQAEILRLKEALQNTEPPEDWLNRVLAEIPYENSR